MSATSWIFLSFLARVGLAIVLGLQAWRALRSGVTNVGGRPVHRRSDPRGFWLATGVQFCLALIFGVGALFEKPVVQAVRTFLGLQV